MNYAFCVRPYIPYLDNEAKESVRNFKYRGGDRGFFYGIFWSPLATAIVERLPNWCNPNTLTLTGFSFIIMPYIVLFSQFGTSMSDLSPKIPLWFNISMGICYFLYRIFDEMDGKQARKSNNSSPLGMMFDHGCDSFTTGLMFMIVCKVLYVGDGIIAWAFVNISLFCFHMAAIEEYYVGEMVLGLGNGVSDGAPATIIFITGLGFCSREFITQELVKGVWYSKLNLVLSLLVFVPCSCTILNNFYTIFKRTRDGSAIGEKLVLKDLFI